MGTFATETYVVSDDLLFTELLEEIVDLVLSHNGIVGEHHFVQGAVIENDTGHVPTDIAQVGDRGGGGTIAHDFIVCSRHGIIGPTRFKTGVGQLVPPADIDNRIGQKKLLDVVVDGFFLQW